MPFTVYYLTPEDKLVSEMSEDQIRNSLESENRVIIH